MNQQVPLAIQLYGVNKPDYLPCGCWVEVNDKGEYNHYVKPGCQFDDKWHPAIRGYNYKPWKKPRAED